MKYFLFFIVFVLISSQSSMDDVKHNCTIPEGKEECCWTHPNGCCIEPTENMLCQDVLTQCCKNKNGTIYINDGYENENETEPIKIPIYYEAIKINWIIILLSSIFVF